MGALVSWWTIFMTDAVILEQQVAESELRVSAHRHAVELGNDPTSPILKEGLVSALELVRCSDDLPKEVVPLLPHHPKTCIQPSVIKRAEIQQRLERRQAMVMGEGIFLFGLLAVCSFMLYYLIGQKQRHAVRMESFFYAATHEMKTPLTGIKTLLETLRAGRVPEAERDKLLDLGLEGCQRLERRIENVLIAGGLQTGGQQAHITSIELTPLLDRYIKQRAHTLAGRPEDVQLTTTGEQDLTALADKAFLMIILDNLVDNGLKYGGPDPLVEISLASQGGSIQIVVSDQGIGFDPTQKEALFTPYRRALSSGHTTQHGTGLGLSIARDLCRKMGGDLIAHSEGLDSGATFTVTLRRADRELRA